MCHKTYSWRIFEQHACQLQMSPYSYSSMSTSQHVACLCALSLTAVTSKGNSTRHQRAHALDLTLRSTRPRGLASYPTTAQCASAPHSQSMQHPAKRNLESSAGPSMLRKIPHRAAYPATWAEPGLRALAKASAFDAAACVKPRRFALSLTRLELLHARHNEAGCFGSAAAPTPPPLSRRPGRRAGRGASASAPPATPAAAACARGRPPSRPPRPRSWPPPARPQS